MDETQGTPQAHQQHAELKQAGLSDQQVTQAMNLQRPMSQAGFDFNRLLTAVKRYGPTALMIAEELFGSASTTTAQPADQTQTQPAAQQQGPKTNP